MAKYSHSEVVGNTAQGRGNTMFNAPAEFERRVVEGNTAQIIQHIYATGASLLETGGSNQSKTPAHGGAGSIPEITASLSQLGSNHSAYMPPQYDVVAAGTWKQRTARVCDEIRGVIESIESVNSEIRQDFDTLGDQNAGLTDFEDYEVLFDLTVNELKLTGRIEEIFRTKWTSVAPPIRISEVDEITARLSEILATLEGAKLDFHPVSSIIARPTVKSKKNLRPRAQKYISVLEPRSSSQTGVRKSIPKQRLRYHPEKSAWSTKGPERLKGKMQVLRGLVSGLQGVLYVMRPPSSNIELPQELKVAKFAAGMLYRSLGNLCPNPDHATHDVLFRLDTTEAVFPTERKGEFRLRVAFEGSSDCPTWFDINSVVQLREAALDGDNDDMDVDVAVVSASVDGNMPFDFPDPRQQEVIPRPSISSSRSHMQRFAGDHTARFCLYNHRQQVRSSSLVAAELRDSDACTHIFYYPETEDMEQNFNQAPRKGDIKLV